MDKQDFGHGTFTTTAIDGDGARGRGGGSTAVAPSSVRPDSESERGYRQYLLDCTPSRARRPGPGLKRSLDNVFRHQEAYSQSKMQI